MGDAEEWNVRVKRYNLYMKRSVQETHQLPRRCQGDRPGHILALFTDTLGRCYGKLLKHQLKQNTSNVYILFCLLFYAIVTVFQLYHDADMIRRKPEPILLPTQRIFNLPHHIGLV